MNYKLINIALLLFWTFSLKAQYSSDSLNSNFLNSNIDILQLYRSDNPASEKIYRIWFDDYQVLELIENNESQVRGKLVNYVTKIARNKKNNKIINQTLKIPEESAKRLVKKFEENNIETLLDCRDIDGYVIGCDGSSVTFEIKTPIIQRTYYYWEPEFQTYQDSTNINVIAVRQILIAMNKEFNCSQLFKNFIGTLGFGKYSWGMILMTKE
jgi:hypothetical protein